VIGAGAAGVSALQQLREAGYEVECFEKTDRVGGHWHTDYEALHLITSRDMTAFEGFPMPTDYRTSRGATRSATTSSPTRGTTGTTT
jgi:cation diffusion facilitator CzcD-associated flavoprotein CzcO